MLLLRSVLILIVSMNFAGVSQPAPFTQAASPAKSALTNQDVGDLLKAGLAPEVVIAKIKAGPTNFDTSSAALKDLKAAGIPDSVIVAMVEASAPAKQPVTYDSGAKAAPNTDNAHLRVYRARRFEGSALAPSIYVDDKQVARIGNGRRCSIKLTPGHHTIRSDDKSSAIELDAKGGAEYYIRVDEATGFWKGHGKLTMLLPEQGSAEYKLQKPVEDDRKFAKEMIEGDSTQ
jgi:hypothetical protein